MTQLAIVNQEIEDLLKLFKRFDNIELQSILNKLSDDKLSEAEIVSTLEIIERWSRTTHDRMSRTFYLSMAFMQYFENSHLNAPDEMMMKVAKPLVEATGTEELYEKWLRADEDLFKLEEKEVARYTPSLKSTKYDRLIAEKDYKIAKINQDKAVETAERNKYRAGEAWKKALRITDFYQIVLKLSMDLNQNYQADLKKINNMAKLAQLNISISTVELLEVIKKMMKLANTL
jgi:hypothetical protein